LSDSQQDLQKRMIHKVVKTGRTYKAIFYLNAWDVGIPKNRKKEKCRD